MTNEQLYLAIGVPILFNALLFGMIVTFVNGQISEVRADIREIRSDMKLLTGKVYEMMAEKP